MEETNQVIEIKRQRGRPVGSLGKAKRELLIKQTEVKETIDVETKEEDNGTQTA